MNHERRFMSLLKDHPPQVSYLGNHQAVPKVDNTLIIYRETSSNSLLDVSLDAGNSRISLLGGYDLVLKGRFHHQSGKRSVSSNVKVKLT
jgi:hypothetical protein